MAYNYVRGFRDGINTVRGWAEKGFDPENKNVSIDIYNNDITQVGDDFIETEPSAHNIRVYRNRCTNTQTCGISAQPTYGGPIYIMRNTIYNNPRGVPLKFNVHPSGVIVYHNTFATKWRNFTGWSNGHFRNNIFMGAVETATLTDYSTMDYDALMKGKIRFGMPNLGWRKQEEGRLKPVTFPNLKSFCEATGYEKHGVIVDYGIFRELKPAVGKEKTYDPASIDFSLKPGGAAVDAGARLPNVNDGFTGEAPDLGAWEAGVEPPHYGPRE